MPLPASFLAYTAGFTLPPLLHANTALPPVLEVIASTAFDVLATVISSNLPATLDTLVPYTPMLPPLLSPRTP